jgi:hypothetical protein
VHDLQQRFRTVHITGCQRKKASFLKKQGDQIRVAAYQHIDEC